MITQENFKNVLITLGFNDKSGVYSKHFAQSDCELKVEFNFSKIIYPEKLIVSGEFVTNFFDNENFVVFECVHRLLEKGYQPQHIELEPKWKLGHGASGGRADILVRDQQHKPLLIIECKTAGKEFEKAWKEMLLDGGQLFSYVEQEKEVAFVCLYASDFDEKNLTISIEQRIVSHKDNPDILAEDSKLKDFRSANNVKERFHVWKETYQLEFTEKGIFEDNIQAYHIGKDKYTLAVDTKVLESIDIKGKYHEFRTILRKHNVSRRENAFEVLVNLFLCKIVDETEHPHDLKFYWKGIAYDNYFDLVDRLQELYKIGMSKFLQQEIVYVSNQAIEDAFWAIKQEPNATKRRIKEIFRELKFYKGLDFEFIKVFNKQYFDKNAKILLEIIQMWQGLRLKTTEQNQFLGDMFEFFLDNGIKQTEGQFFTPVPICKFIVMSLPLESYIQSSNEPLKVIDYACGSGHFLTEYALQIHPLVTRYKCAEPSEYYKNIYGIEKEDRLAKVAKVSAFMYGRDEIQVLDADALAVNPEIKEESFDILIANPPFAVEDFLLTLEETDREKYQLFETVSDIGNKNIQCFFLERAKQLLAGHGVMGVIVPSSVLSNSDAMHTVTREILLKHFDFVSIVELGSNTFGKTGTNTVILFLRRKAQRPEPAEYFWNRVENFFSDWDNEVEMQSGAYLDIDFVQQYCQHVAISFEAYQSLLRGAPDETLLATEMFKDYQAGFDNLNEIKKLKESKPFKAKTLADQQSELNKRFLVYLQAIEKQKLYYFILARHHPQKVLLVKSPSDNKEQKQFLGYEWSGAKGNEGIKYNGGETVYDMITPMFNPSDRGDVEKVNFYIQQNFLGNAFDIPEQLQPVMTTTRLENLLDFSRKEFNLALSLTPQKNTTVETKWEWVKLGKVAEVLIGGTPSRSIKRYFEGENLWVSIAEMNGNIISDTKEKITDEGVKDSNVKLIPKGTTLLSFKLSIGKTAIAGANLYTNEAIAGLIPKDETVISNAFLFHLFNTKQIDLSTGNNAIGQSLNSKYLREELKIPLPPLSIQQQIVAKCEAIQSTANNALQVIENANSLISSKMKTVFHATMEDKLENLSILLKRGKSTKYGNSNIQVIKSGQARGYTDFDFTEKHFASSDFQPDERKLQKGDLLINSTGVGTAGRVTRFELDGDFVADSHITIFRPNSKVLSQYVLYCLAHIGFKTIEKMAKGSTGQIELTLSIIGNLKIPVIPLSEQEKLVAEIEILEQSIRAARQVIDNAGEQKQAIMKKYL